MSDETLSSAKLKMETAQAFIQAFGPVKTERDQRTLAAFLAGLENAPGAAAKRQAIVDWNRRKRRKKTPPAQTSPRNETT